jgi:hypothetical protein
MADERTEIGSGALARWLVAGVLLLAGVGACLLWASSTPVVLAPQGLEADG